MDKIKSWVSQNVEKTLIGSIGLMFALVFVLYMIETNAAPPVDDGPNFVDPSRVLLIDINQGPYLRLLTLQKVWEPIEDSAFRPLVDVNPYDPKLVREGPQLREEAEQKVNDARVQLTNSNLDRAKELAQEALDLVFNLKQAQDLMVEIEKRQAAAAPPTGGGEQPTPTPGAPPEG